MKWLINVRNASETNNDDCLTHALHPCNIIHAHKLARPLSKLAALLLLLRLTV